MSKLLKMSDDTRRANLARATDPAERAELTDHSTTHKVASVEQVGEDYTLILEPTQ